MKIFAVMECVYYEGCHIHALCDSEEQAIIERAKLEKSFKYDSQYCEVEVHNLIKALEGNGL